MLRKAARKGLLGVPASSTFVTTSESWLTPAHAEKDKRLKQGTALTRRQRATESGWEFVVTETMLTVALKSWVGLRTRPDAVRRLRSLADQLEQDQDQPRDLPPESGKRY